MSVPAGAWLVHDLLDAAATRFAAAPAVSDADGCDSYAELAERSATAGNWLRACGVRFGDRVVLHLSGGRDMAALLYAVLRLGAVAVPVNPRTGPFHLQWILTDAEPALVVSQRDGVRTVAGLATVPVRDVAEMSRHRVVDGRLRMHAGPGPTDVALLLYTSGSTAMPRAVVCPHERVLFAVAAIDARLRYTVDDVVLCRVPVSFDYGLYQLFLAAAVGARVAFRPDLTEAMILREAGATGATVLPILPALATILCQLAARDRITRTAIRLVTNTGAALTPVLARRLRSLLPDTSIVPMYGMTECKRITIAEADEDIAYPGTVGHALDGTWLRVVDATGEPVATGTVGEVRVGGPHVMAGYWHAPEATIERFHRPESPGRMLRTGDYGHLDDDGRLYLAGRRDDIFKRNGVRTSTQEVEAVVLDVPGVAAAAVLPPAPDGELVAVVVGHVREAEVLGAAAARVESAKVPDRCLVVPELPTTTNGKVDKVRLRALCHGAAG